MTYSRATFRVKLFRLHKATINLTLLQWVTLCRPILHFNCSRPSYLCLNPLVLTSLIKQILTTVLATKANVAGEGEIRS